MRLYEGTMITKKNVLEIISNIYRMSNVFSCFTVFRDGDHSFPYSELIYLRRLCTGHH